MAGQDEPYDPNRWLIDWGPYVPQLTIACICGAELSLDHLFNTCPSCKRVWNKWGRQELLLSPRHPKTGN